MNDYERTPEEMEKELLERFGISTPIAPKVPAAAASSAAPGVADTAGGGSTPTDVVVPTPIKYPMGLTPDQVRLGAGIAGVVGGPTAQRFVERHAGPEAAEATRVARAEAQARMAARSQQLRDEYLLSHGIAPPPGRDQVSAILQGTIGDVGTTGRAREAGFNAETSQRAGAEKLAAQRARELGLTSTAQVFAEAPGMTATENGILVPRDVAQQRADAAAVRNAQAEVLHAAQSEQVARQAEQHAAQQIARETPGPLRRFGKALGAAVKSPITGGALGGLGAALSVPEAIERWHSGDRSGAVIAALGGASGLASMVPGLGIPAAVVGAGTIPAMYINDVMKGKIAPPKFEDVPPTGNPMGN